jgi:hypothetical protein
LRPPSGDDSKLNARRTKIRNAQKTRNAHA